MRIAETKDGKIVYRDATAEEEQELTERNQTKGKQALTAEERLDAMEKRITELEKQLQTEKK